MMKWISRLITVVAILAAMLVSELPSNAAGYLYAGSRKTVNCGVLMLNSGATTGNFTQPLNASYAEAGHIDLNNPKCTPGPGVGDIFNLLDYLTSMKPAGWSLDNPYAPVDDQGKKPDKSNPLFWRVNLSTARNLSRMDILYLPASGSVSLGDEDREKLRRFVDNGGVLWVDNAGKDINSSATSPLTFTDGLGLPSDTPGTFFLPNVYFKPSTATTGRDIAASRHHPLLTSPYWIDDQEIPMLGLNWGACAVDTGIAPFLTAPIFTDVLFPIVSKFSNPPTNETSVAANAYGSGRVVATANYVGGGCFLPSPHNMPSLKFAYNIMAWASSWTDLRKDPRHSGKSIDTVGGTELLKMWSLKSAPPNGESGAVIYKNVAFYSSGSTLYALDVKPQEDLDQNGYPDDGLQKADYPPGLVDDGQDIIWIWEGDGQLSAPEIVTAQDPNTPSETAEAVLVLSSTGKVHMLYAFPDVNGTRPPPPTPIVPPWDTFATSEPNPPTYINGWVFTAGGDGRLYANNPALEIWNSVPRDPVIASSWYMPLDGITGLTLKSGPNFGFVSTGNSGAVVGMVYWCVTEDPALPGAERNDYIYGVPVYVKNDRLKPPPPNKTSSDRTRAEFQTSYSDANVSSTPAPVVRVTVGSMPSITLDSSSVHANENLTGANTRGVITVDYAGGLPTDAMVYADYSLDYAPGAVSSPQYPHIRVALQPNSNSSNDPQSYLKTEIEAIPALGPDSMIYVNGVRKTPNLNMGGGGSVYGLKNDGTSQQTRWNYMLHSGVPNEALQGITTGVVPLPGLLVEKPQSDQQLKYMLRPQSYSSPVVAGDKVFVTVTGGESAPTDSRGALLCFKATPDFVIRINENGGFGLGGTPIKVPKKLYDTATGRPLSIKAWQPNLLSDLSGLGPTAESVNVPEKTIDRERGTITFDTFDQPKLRGGIVGTMDNNTFSPSLPVWVTVDNVEVPIDWTTWGPSVSLASLLSTPTNPVTIPTLATDSVDLSGWNNLLWYYVVPPFNNSPCPGIHSSPVVIGDSVYFETDDGIIYALNAETGESLGGPIDPFDSTDTNWKPDTKYVLWREKVSDADGALSEGVNVSASGSNGVLLVPGPDGLYAYSNPSTLVADNNRLVEVDAAGELTWSVDAFFVPVSIPPSNNQPPARRSVPVNKPARARYIWTGEILVTNSGTNQVFKIDKSGSVGVQKVVLPGENYQTTNKWIRWVYDKFTDPKNLLRPGQPTELRSPTDAIFWTEMEPVSTGDKTVVTHCMIADSGNNRVVDLVYRFRGDNLIVTPGTKPDAQSLFILPELNWVSNTESKAERYVFDCLQAPVLNPTEGGHDVWAAISNFRVDPNSPNPQGLGGAIVDLKYRRSRGVGVVGWDYGATGSGEIIGGCDHVTPGVNPAQPLANPRYFQAIMRAQGGIYTSGGMYLIICDNHGVYEAGPTGSAAMPIVKMISEKDYRENIDRDEAKTNTQFLGVPLAATNVQEMPNGHWLITNGYSGSDKSGTKTFNGEVFEYEFDQDNPTGIGKIVWSAPKLEFTYPNSTDYDWTQTMERSYILQQPRSAFRQF